VKVLITGSDGFIGKNLRLYLIERKDIDVVCFTRSDEVSQLPELLKDVDYVFHLAGINRTVDQAEYMMGNTNLTKILCDAVGTVVSLTGKKVTVLYASSTQAACDNVYGSSKLGAEKLLIELRRIYDLPVYIFRLPNVFGKWCKQNYNSVVATFCHNIIRGLPIHIADPDSSITLAYIDDVIECFMRIMDGEDTRAGSNGFDIVAPLYTITVGELAQKIFSFKEGRSTLVVERVGTGLMRALYSTYISYLPVDLCTYSLKRHADARGSFVEMLKTRDSGQFSYFTAHPGVTRGGHYHHSKTEKFLVISGRARFKFKHMQTGQSYELITSGDVAQVVETIPGWAHDITNVGRDDLIVMLWANEIFDEDNPDTFTHSL